MKKKLLFYSIILISLNSHAQGSVPETIETDFWLDNNWLFITETNYTFNQDCFPLVGISEVLNFTTNEFDNISRITNTYNSENVIIEFVIELWNEGLEDWENSTRAIFDFNGANLLESVTYNWIDNAWLQTTRTIGNFNDTLLAESVSQDWNTNSNTWINNERSTFTYNIDGSLNMKTNYTWNTTNWLEEELSIPEYNTNGDLSIDTRFFWDAATNSWVNQDRTLFTYNASHFLIEQERQDWEITTSNWIENSLDESFYDVDDNVEESLNSEWNTTTMQYEPKIRSLRTHNAEGDPTEVISQNFSGDWVNSTRTRNTYPPCATLSNTDIVNEDRIKVYPNPTTDSVIIDLNKNIDSIISLYDMKGKQILKKNFNSSSYKLDISKLSKGVYLLKINSDFINEVKKVIIN